MKKKNNNIKLFFLFLHSRKKKMIIGLYVLLFLIFAFALLGIIVGGLKSIDDVIHRFIFIGTGPYSLLTSNENKQLAFQSYVESYDRRAKLHIVATSRPSSEKTTLIFYLHGNAGSIDFNWYSVIQELSIIANKEISSENCEGTLLPNVVIATFDYRQFGRSRSCVNPTPNNAVEDAECVLKFLQTEFKPTKILMYGKSLGAAVAVHVNDIHAFPLFLEVPFLGESSVKLIPRWIPFNERFPCKHQIKRSHSSITVVLGEFDNLIDNDKIIELLPQSIILPKLSHNNLCFSKPFIQIFQSWIKQNI
jgi:hypothetical protein